MSENPLKKPNRELQIKRDESDIRSGVSLYDIDSAIITYLQDVVLPTINENGISVKIPVVYGNSERWEGARQKGIYRDQKGKIQLPIFMIRRSSVAKNDAIPMLNRHVSYKAVTKWSKENRYSHFSILTGSQPKYDVYNITMPDYVEVTYECMGWTSYTEQLNQIVESLNWASDEYWGDKQKFKFMSTITDYNIINEVDQGNQRINRVECTITVKAYLLPETFDGEQTNKKSFTTRRVIVSPEVDLTADGRMEAQLTNPLAYNANKDIVDYLSINTTEISPISIGNDTVVFNGIKPIKMPAGLNSSITNPMVIDGINYDIKVYNNAIQITSYTATISNNILTISSIPGLTNGDDITIIGKFINV